MSIKYLNWAFDLELPANDGKAVLIALANFADERGSCYPSQERLAINTGLTERTVRRHLDRLHELGYVSSTVRREGQRRVTNRYYLHPETDILSPVDALPDTASGSERTTQDSTREDAELSTGHPDTGVAAISEFSTGHPDRSTGHPDTLYRTSCPSEPDTVSSKPPVNHHRTTSEPPDMARGTKMARKRNRHFEVIAECWKGRPYHELTLTASQEQTIGTAAAQLVRIDAPVERIPVEWARISRQYENITPFALVKHWDATGNQPTPSIDDIENPYIRALIRLGESGDYPDSDIRHEAHGTFDDATQAQRIGRGSRPAHQNIRSITRGTG